MLETHPQDPLRLLCGARLDGREVILDGPTEHTRQRSRQRDKVFPVRHGGGLPADVYHVEVQVKRTEDFQERMVSYWADLALKYRRADHRIHQVVIWPTGGGYPGSFHRDQERLDYRVVNVPDDLDPGALLSSPLAPLALWSRKPPPDLVDRFADRIGATGTDEEKIIQIELGMLVGDPLATQILDALRRRGMNNILEQSESGREIARRNLEEGIERGNINSMRLLLQARFGDIADLDVLARHLATADHAGNVSRIVAGAALDDLRS